MLVTALVAWLPLVALATLQGHAIAADPHESLLLDLQAYVRYLVAAPLFVGAASVYLPQLAWAVRTFVEAGLIQKHDLPRYDALVVSTRRLLTSHVIDAGLICLAYVVTLTASPTLKSEVPTWAASGDGHLLLAGWWRMLVSQPLFLALWGVWFWRLLLWTRFLWTVGRLDLRLVAGHPDRLGGLRFVLIPLRGFAILAFALGAMSAGTVGQAILIDGRLPIEFKFLIGAHAVGVVVLFAGPLLLLSMPILHLQTRGTIEYGRLASRLGRQFEERWTDAGHRAVNAEALEAADFSATVDMFGVVANAQRVNPLVLDFQHVIMIAVATLLPYVPLVFAVWPFDELVQFALKALT